MKEKPSTVQTADTENITGYVKLPHIKVGLPNLIVILLFYIKYIFMSGDSIINPRANGEPRSCLQADREGQVENWMLKGLFFIFLELFDIYFESDEKIDTTLKSVKRLSA